MTYRKTIIFEASYHVHIKILNFLRCPKCSPDSSLYISNHGDEKVDEVLFGTLTCRTCNAEFKIQDWIYGNLLILLISVLVTYIWVIKNKT